MFFERQAVLAEVEGDGIATVQADFDFQVSGGGLSAVAVGDVSTPAGAAFLLLRIGPGDFQEAHSAVR